jgi:hypothetical protein
MWHGVLHDVAQETRNVPSTAVQESGGGQTSPVIRTERPYRLSFVRLTLRNSRMLSWKSKSVSLDLIVYAQSLHVAKPSALSMQYRNRYASGSARYSRTSSDHRLSQGCTKPPNSSGVGRSKDLARPESQERRSSGGWMGWRGYFFNRAALDAGETSVRRVRPAAWSVTRAARKFHRMWIVPLCSK